LAGNFQSSSSLFKLSLLLWSSSDFTHLALLRTDDVQTSTEKYLHSKEMLPTPSTSHVNYNHIYEPSEDSFLLLDTLSLPSETEFLRSRFPQISPSPLILEVGPGSGVVLAFVTAQANHIFGREDVCILGIDVNNYACLATCQTAELAIKEARQSGTISGVFADTICGNLTDPIKSDSVDVLIFNPPYVPSESVPANPEVDNSQLDAFAQDLQLSSLATDGGKDGMEVTDRLLAELPSILSARGVAYILLCAQNMPDAVMARIQALPDEGCGNWGVEKVGVSGKKAGWEKLCVIRIWHER
jgi:release factor glutamine methyltransferase